MDPRNILISLAIKFNGDWNRIYKSLKLRTDYEDEEEIIRNCQSLQCKVVTIMDEDYPQQLNYVIKPPFVLFYYGDLSLTSNLNKCIGVVGSREASPFGLSTTQKLVNGLPKDVNVVSGLAYGVDSMAHKAAIESGHKTIAVLGSGIDICYPSINIDLYEEIKRNHLVISEYPPGSTPNNQNFPIRNRIIAALSKCLLVTEAKVRSGTMITVGISLALGRDVLCIPSINLGDSGTNLCIKQGAFLVETSEDINAFF